MKVTILWISGIWLFDMNYMQVTIFWVFDILLGKNSKRLGRKCIWSGSGVLEIFEKTKFYHKIIAKHI